ncbi:MAG: hypothetical protein ACFE8U_08690 [Candidatus Hermodarchaeota archaeon]
MKRQLRYLLIIQPGGLPLYSHSVNFETDFNCQTFNERISKSEINPFLVSGLFDAIKNLFSELLHDNFKLIDIGFFSYHISGLVHENLFFMGIFETRKEGVAFVTEEYLPYIGEIAEAFSKEYPKTLNGIYEYDVSKYDGFTENLVKMGFALSLQDCRDCLSKCADEEKDCLPHLYYFKEVKTSSC